MPSSRVEATTERGKVIVTYNGKQIKKLDPDEAIECGGDIAAAGRRAKRYHWELTDEAQERDSDDGDAAYPDNRSLSQGSKKLEGDTEPADEQEDDWRGENKNSLLNGKL